MHSLSPSDRISAMYASRRAFSRLSLILAKIREVVPRKQELTKSGLFVVVLIVISARCLWAVDLYLDVSKAKYRRIVIAIPDFQGDGELGA